MNDHDQTAPEWSPRMSDAEANAEARRIIDEIYRPTPPRPMPTSFRDDTPVPAVGQAEPVHQDDRRIVPAWAAGTAVASLGIGAGTTGVGCGVWLVLKGFSSMSVTGVVCMGVLFSGVAFVALSIGAAIARAKRSVSKHIYTGPVTKNTHVTTHTRGTFSRTHNTFHG
ncbi:hypothetical protein [Streptomyces longispororuber]|uniref:hypothetical protein n=1 Tax=Streptomyces longispororuber TaxID=68230 RepID=UPI002108B847|nr:hypothetical protein [Streptomyces longispororuber]MCQ4212372.1 hypothetical protein [Streptomyces longispororuber]